MSFNLAMKVVYGVALKRLRGGRKSIIHNSIKLYKLKGVITAVFFFFVIRVHQHLAAIVDEVKFTKDFFM